MPDPPPLPPSLREAAASRARALSRRAASGIVVRSGHPREAKAVAAEICLHLGARPLFLDGDPPDGLGPWLWLAAAIPVICAELAPGERRRLKDIPGWNGPVLVAAGPDGSFEREGEALPVWRVPVPTPAERVGLWQAATGDDALAEHLGPAHRHACARIAELARAGRYQAELAGADRIGPDAVAAAARSGTGGDLGMLAELMAETIPDEALVLPVAIRRELESLIARCLARDALADALGPASRARYRPGVRALFVGPSGTGKTLAVGWMASRLGLPLYRVDLASVTSKYIGETEKNLAQLFARAEHSEVVLLFDEADSLFGKRTDVKDSNDRFANAQTNYLLSAHRVLRRHRHPHQQQPREIRLGLHAPARRHRRLPRARPRGAARPLDRAPRPGPWPRPRRPESARREVRSRRRPHSQHRACRRRAGARPARCDRANPISSSLLPLSTASSERRYLRDWRRQTHGDTG